MALFTPLTPPEDPRLARFAQPGRTWWLLGTVAEEVPGDVLAWLVSQAGVRPESGWVALVWGRRGRLVYVAGQSGKEVREGGTVTRVLSPLSSDDAIAVLDRAETAGVSVLLLLVDMVDVAIVFEALCGPELTGALDRVHLVVTVHAGASRAVVGVRGERPPTMSGAFVRSTSPSMPPPPMPSRTRRNAVTRGRALAVAGLAACVVAGGSLLARHGGRDPTPPPPQATSSAVPAIVAALLPEPRYTPTLVYDQARQNMVLFGGGEPAAATWLWANQAWEPAVSSRSPSDRFGSAAAYDPAIKKVMLFGGRDIFSGLVPNDTWAWDGHTWTQLARQGPGPPGYEFSGMAWDEKRRQMVLLTPAVNGASPDGAATWTWAGAHWRQMPTKVRPPTTTTTMAFDPATQDVVALTGAPAPARTPSTWSWDGTSWRELHPAHEPVLGGLEYLARVPGRSELLLVATAEASAFATTTWVWDGRDWTIQHPAFTPGPLVGLAADGADEALIALGHGKRSPVDGAWAWTGAQWVRLTVAPPSGPATTAAVHPFPPRQFAASAYDERRHQLVLFGGMTQTVGPSAPQVNDWDTWIFDGQHWARSPTATHPPSTGPMAYDPVSGTIIIVADANGARLYASGLTRPVTWSWDGQSWRALRPASELPPGTPPVAMVTDPLSKTVVAITACCRHSDGSQNTAPILATWSWNGSRWLYAHPKTEFGGGPQVSLAYDQSSHLILGVGGNGADEGIATWAWDGATWTELGSANPVVFDPLTAVMAGDPSTRSVVLVERQFQSAVTFADAGGTQVWDGTTWTDHLDRLPSGADTAFGDAAVYEDTTLGRLVVVSSTSQDYSEEWMWTGLAWMQLAVG